MMLSAMIETKTRQHEEATRHDPARRPVHQPTDIGRELLRLRAWQEHAIVQGVQELVLADPTLLLDQDAVHHGDLSGGPPNESARDPQPGAECLAERDTVRRGGFGTCLPGGPAGQARSSCTLQRGRAAASPPASCGSRRWRHGTSGRRLVEHHAGFELSQVIGIHAGQAERGGEQTRRFGRKVEPGGVGAAHDGGQSRSGSVASPNSSTMMSKVQSSPRWLQKMPSPSMSNGVAPKRSATPVTSDGATNRKTAFGSTKRRMSHGQAMRSILGRDRVTQTVRPCASRGGSFASGTIGRPASAHAERSALEDPPATPDDEARRPRLR